MRWQKEKKPPPSNEMEKYQNIVRLVGTGPISKETAIKMLGMVEDPEADEAAEKTVSLIKQTKPVPTNE